MPIEFRNGRRTAVHDVAVAVDSQESANGVYERLFGVLVSTTPAGHREFIVEANTVVRVMDQTQPALTRPKLICTRHSYDLVASRIRQSGCRILGWFSLQRAWIFDDAPERNACTLLVRDPFGISWEFRLATASAATPIPQSRLPVSDVKVALQWYPRLFSAFEWGDVTNVAAHGACTDIFTERWSARVYPFVQWPFRDIQFPLSWSAVTGEAYVERSAFDETKQRIESMGLTVRGASTFGAFSDPFGHEWYFGSDSSPG